MSTVFKWIFTVFAIICFAVAVFWNAPWHFGTAFMSAVLAISFKHDEKKEKN
jgi:hypothetical protein